MKASKEINLSSENYSDVKNIHRQKQQHYEKLKQMYARQLKLKEQCIEEM
jgi:hypothetical protein